MRTTLALSFFQVTLVVGTPAQLFSSVVPNKVLATFKALPNPISYPQYTDTSGKWLFFQPDTWTSGFFPVTGYALNTRQALCGSSPTNGLGVGDWLSLGRAASNGLIPLETRNTVGHDVGFISFPFVEELKINPQNQTAITAVKNLANLLAARFSPVVGCTRSWDSSDPTDFQVIIDNMMNLELLFHAADLTGNSTLRKIATTHADTTMLNHIRPDGSTWHVVDYNSTTGKVIQKRTAQGYSDNSTWSRGQAWAVYGFANMYRLTKDVNYLGTARRLADYFINTMPADGIVPWDFNAPVPRPADSSAAMIVTNALLLLSRVETDSGAAGKWRDAALRILNDMTNLAWRPSWQSLLSNGTVNKPANNQLTGTVYGDYYFITARNDLITMNLAKCS